ncbi:hypothetical protein [Mixta theicola]|uniref:hypothetical protein n=1 Tax=Mixta theicola TaxID=1458355 RepID=UPI0024E0DFB6|nr:hypothetical protein [Mixta theicola]
MLVISSSATCGLSLKKRFSAEQIINILREAEPKPLFLPGSCDQARRIVYAAAVWWRAPQGVTSLLY